MDKEIVGQKLKYLRRKEKYSMEKLANTFNDLYNSNISKSMISNWETGKYLISGKNLELYINYFQAPLTYFTKDYVKPKDFKIHKTIMKTAEDIVDKVNFDKVNIDWLSEEHLSFVINELNSNLDKLNIDGLVKVSEYSKDIAKIDEYLLNEYKKDK